jgi:FKBP-type peptidyl-prolyl cis-trans isomerase
MSQTLDKSATGASLELALVVAMMVVAWMSAPQEETTRAQGPKTEAVATAEPEATTPQSAPPVEEASSQPEAAPEAVTETAPEPADEPAPAPADEPATETQDAPEAAPVEAESEEAAEVVEETTPEAAPAPAPAATPVEDFATQQQTYLVENGTKEGVIVTESGLQYRVISSGGGTERPNATDEVTVHYAGRLIDGTEFDSSYARGAPAEFPLNRVIPGWTEGLQYMAVGDKFELTIPAYLAYGERGAGGVIPGGATLVFDVELLGIK